MQTSRSAERRMAHLANAGKRLNDAHAALGSVPKRGRRSNRRLDAVTLERKLAEREGLIVTKRAVPKYKGSKDAELQACIDATVQAAAANADLAERLGVNL